MQGRCAHTQIAFFGGSFTAIPQAEQLELLRVAAAHCGPGGFAGIRVSTRPDCIDQAVLQRLREHNVLAIELGVQSMDDAVLAANRRGHTAEDAVSASRLIRAYGFELGHQMMVGMYKDRPGGAQETARALAALKPDTVRIYPVMVLPETPLEQLYRAGRYAPLALEQAVDVCAELLEFFTAQGIRVIRLGLQDTPDLRRAVAGVRHPAFRELCESRILLQRARDKLENPTGLAAPKNGKKAAALPDLPESATPPRRPAVVWVGRSQLSAMVGQKGANRKALADAGWDVKICTDQTLGYLQVRAEHTQQTAQTPREGKGHAVAGTGDTGVQVFPG